MKETEKQFAIRLANKVLDTPSRDPDDDLSTLARQFLRAIESKWRPIESAPKDGAWIFAYSKALSIHRYPIVVFWNENEWECPNPLHNVGMGIGFYPTHWMPLPEPPVSP